MNRIVAACAIVLLAWATLVFAAPAAAAPPPIDPRQMSGIGRPDPQVPAGYLTVRCLGEGGFSDPVVGVEVALQLRSADGTQTETRTATTEAQGRATFGELEAFFGGTATATAELGGTVVQSQSLALSAATGTRVMLVQGAGPAGRTAGSPTPATGAQKGIPMPGIAFPLAGTPAGELTIGTYDLAAKQPLVGVEVTLTLTPPQGDPEVRKLTTDARGKVVFEQLVPPAVPSGTQLVVEATLVEGGEHRTSSAFEMGSASGMAVVLAEGADNMPPPDPTAGTHQAAPVPPPRMIPSQPAGSLQVVVGNAYDEPVKGHPVVVVKKTATGQKKFEGTTDDTGLAVVTDIELAQDAIYYVDVRYDGAPYHSPTFFMDKRGGVSLGMRVFEVTTDPGVLRAAVQYHVDPAEGDSAQVVQVLEAKVIEGDKAFWPGSERLEIHAMEGAMGFTVIARAERWLDHAEGAPFATLAAPVPPGEVVNLSVGYFLPTDGSIAVEWSPPFELLDARIVIPDELELEAAGAQPSDVELRVSDTRAFTLGPRGLGVPVAFAVSELPVNNPLYKWVGIGGALAMVFAVGIAMAVQPRTSTRDALAQRREELLSTLAGLSGESDAAKRTRTLAALDRVHRQLRALEDVYGGEE